MGGSVPGDQTMEKAILSLRRSLARARRRIFARNLIQAVLLLAPLALAAWALVVLLRQFDPASQTALTIQMLALTAALLYLLTRTFRGLGDFNVALQLDEAGTLANRTASALEFAGCRAPSPFMQAAVADAARHAALVDVRARLGLWPEKTRNMLLVTALLVPFLVSALTVDFAAMFEKQQTALSRDLPVEPVPPDVPDTPELAQLRVPPRLAPLIEPVRNYIEAWKKNLEKMRQELALRQQELEKKLEIETRKAIHADARGPAAGKTIAGIEALRTAITDDRVHLSDLQTMGVHDTTEYRDAFAELDQVAFDGEPEINDVEKLQEMMLHAADRKGTSAKQIGQGAAMAIQMSTDADEIGAFRNSLQGAMQESFNEFLRNYANHLGNIVDTKKDLNEQARKSGKPVRMALSSAPPPANAKLKMLRLDKDAAKKMQLSPASFTEANNPQGVQQGIAPTSSKAGSGGGTAEGVIKMQAIETKTQYLEIQGLLGEGKSPIQILEDLDSYSKEDFSSDEYRLLYADYTEGASQVLDAEQIPIEIKSYIRDYFISINPEKIEKDQNKNENRNGRLAPNH